jgi:hypothetical protein
MVRRALVTAGCLLACVAGSTFAQDVGDAPRQATGRFASKDVDFEVWGAYAFEGSVGLGGEPGIRVAVSNAEFVPDYTDNYWHREQWIKERFRDDGIAVVWFHFLPNGEYKGMDYYFGGGNGCGFCFSSEVESSVKLSDGRIGGALAFSDPAGATFDLAFDVPLAPSEYGKPLPADGGDPGRAYLAFHEALIGGDPAAIRPTINDRRRRFLENPAFIQYIREAHPESYELTKALVRDGFALLLTRGEQTVYGNPAKVTTEVHLNLEDGQWVVEDELLQWVGD